MLEDVTAFFCCGHQKFQPLADFPLPGELAEHWRSQRDFEGGIGFRRFHDRACGNLITLNQKLRTTRFVLRQSSLGSAGCRVAHASRVLAKPSRFRGPSRKACFGATPKPTRETRALPGITVNAVFLPAHTIFFVNTNSVPRRRKI